MHIAFSLMVAVPAAALARHAWVRTMWSAYPLLIFFVIVATGNHFWFDAVAGAAVACLAAVGARQLARLRPRRLVLARRRVDERSDHLICRPGTFGASPARAHSPGRPPSGAATRATG